MHVVERENSEKPALIRIEAQTELFARARYEDLRLIVSGAEIAVVCRNLCVFIFSRSDRFSRNYCLVQLHIAGGIGLRNLSELFGITYKHCSKILSRFKKEGVDGLREDTSLRFRNRLLISEEIGKFIISEREKGRTFKEISEVIGFKFKRNIREKSIRAWMGRATKSEEPSVQLSLLDMNGEDGCANAAPQEWKRNIYAGAMILHGMLEWSGFLRRFLEHVVEDEKTRESSAGVSRVMLTLFFLHALRCKSIEQSKHIVGGDFSFLVGGKFLRAQPLRDAVDEIIWRPGFDRAIDAYYKDLIALTDRGDRIYYTDGHFSSYYGKRKGAADLKRRQIAYIP